MDKPLDCRVGFVDEARRMTVPPLPRPSGSRRLWRACRKAGRDFSICDTAARPKAAKCRIAMFRSEHSLLLPLQIGEYMFDLLGRSAPVVEIQQARHHIVLDQPLAFMAALRALLTERKHSPRRRVRGA